MTDEIRHEMTGLLAAQVDSYAEALEQRDLARSVAVQLEGECAALETERDAEIARANRAEEKLHALREHTLDSNPTLRALHSNAVAYVDAVNALHEVTGAPLSTTIGYLIRQGYLVRPEKVKELSLLRAKISRVEALIEDRESRMTGYDRDLVRDALDGAL